MKYILVTGGVISGIGKGVIASSLGAILKAYGLHVTAIKVDPYINIDAGTFSPYEHGEVFVLADGGEVDLDLGNYERFLDVTLHRENNITTGKIYQEVITRERKGDYLGKTVQVVPHITDSIQEWVQRVSKTSVTADGKEPEICIIELGGTIGDIEGMPFIEAFRQFEFRLPKNSFCCAHVSLIPQPKSTGEPKTKPTQASVRESRRLGLSPDLIICRSELPVDESVKDKISNFCHVKPRQVISLPDCSSIYRVPAMLEAQGVGGYLMEHFALNLVDPKIPRKQLKSWTRLSERMENLRKTVKIALVGKYTQLEDAYMSVRKALQHASVASSRKLELVVCISSFASSYLSIIDICFRLLPTCIIFKYIEADDLEEEAKHSRKCVFHDAWKNLCSAHGILVPGGFGTRGTEGKIAAINFARTHHVPFLGICMGMQCMVIEFARNVLKWESANSTEFDEKTPYPVVFEMPEHHPGVMGGTMRLGLRKTILNDSKSLIKKLYQGASEVQERHRHRYEVNPKFVPNFEAAGLKFVGQDVDGERMECVELPLHPFYVGVQFHPEYQTRPLKPSAVYLGFVMAASGKLPALWTKQNAKFASSDSTFDSDSEGIASEESGFLYDLSTSGVSSAGAPDNLVQSEYEEY
ncbi:unnamed protein product [Notodromas monacha]|uniref:CTP synthase n=1 Tax=Notodromas monacha TaxID=399045 RepID=A0A7R9BLP4_9CRUS|nr:unnamed protein product [Notodromas monacha]CAG0917785.1 unnamed protein product [Notodromas monacha]